MKDVGGKGEIDREKRNRRKAGEENRDGVGVGVAAEARQKRSD